MLAISFSVVNDDFNVDIQRACLYFECQTRTETTALDMNRATNGQDGPQGGRQGHDGPAKAGVVAIGEMVSGYHAATDGRLKQPELRDGQWTKRASSGARALPTLKDAGCHWRAQ